MRISGCRLSHSVVSALVVEGIFGSSLGCVKIAGGHLCEEMQGETRLMIISRVIGGGKEMWTVGLTRGAV